MKKPIPHTVNIHLILLCNYICGFCYAGFPGLARKRLEIDEICEILRQISEAPRPTTCDRRKVTFVGGEPLLHRDILSAIAYAKSLGLVTSLVTNGALLTDSMLQELSHTLDWLTISIDSTENETNRQIGRICKNTTQSREEYLQKIQLAQSLGIHVKINTVVNQKNVHEDFSDFIARARPTRWKILQATRVEEENGSCFSRWEVTGEEYSSFVLRHDNLNQLGVVVVPETQSDIRGSYAMVSPDGRFFDTALGTYNYSARIVDAGIEQAFSEINFSMERFKQRNGHYNFATGRNIGESVS